MHPPRFRLRTLMVAVAVAAVVFGGVETERMRRRASLYRARANRHAEWARH
jgi:hypothetical protein